MKIIIDTSTDDIAGAIRALNAYCGESSLNLPDGSVPPPHTETRTKEEIAVDAHTVPDSKVQIIPNAYKWFKDTHGTKLTAKAVGERAEAENYTPTGKGGRFSLDDIKALFPEPQDEAPPNGEAPSSLSIDDVREVTEKLVNARSDGKQLAAGLVRDTYKVAKLSDLPPDVWPEYIKKAAAYINA